MRVGKEDFEAGVYSDLLHQILTIMPDDSALSEREIKAILERSGRKSKDVQYTRDALDKLLEMGYIQKKELGGEQQYLKMRSPALPQPQQWYTVDEAAQYLRVSRRTIYQLLEEGELTSYRVGKAGHKRFKREDLDRAMHKDSDAELHAMSAVGDPVLAELWDNERDAAYDQI